MLLDAAATEHARRQAAVRLGLRNVSAARVVATAEGGPLVEAVPATGDSTPTTGGRRAGIGPAVPVRDLPASWAAARTALRFTAEGTDQDPGPRTVYADELGGLALLADTVGPTTEPVPDVRALEHAVATAPWAASTLNAVAFSTSLRAAAAELNVHHSTLQAASSRPSTGSTGRSTTRTAPPPTGAGPEDGCTGTRHARVCSGTAARGGGTAGWRYRYTERRTLVGDVDLRAQFTGRQARERGVAQQLASQQHGVGLVVGEDLRGLLGVGDETDGGDGQRGLRLDPGGEGLW